MLSRNAPLLYVQKQGGWASAAVLLRVYSRWLPPDVEGLALQPSATPAQPAPRATGGDGLESAEPLTSGPVRGASSCSPAFRRISPGVAPPSAGPLSTSPCAPT